jgi:hypothetical protein
MSRLAGKVMPQVVCRLIDGFIGEFRNAIEWLQA